MMTRGGGNEGGEGEKKETPVPKGGLGVKRKRIS